jgi:hypothetical protein
VQCDYAVPPLPQPFTASLPMIPSELQVGRRKLDVFWP